MQILCGFLSRLLAPSVKDESKRLRELALVKRIIAPAKYCRSHSDFCPLALTCQRSPVRSEIPGILAYRG
jgi:hypothetical protein